MHRKASTRGVAAIAHVIAEQGLFHQFTRRSRRLRCFAEQVPTHSRKPAGPWRV